MRRYKNRCVTSNVFPMAELFQYLLILHYLMSSRIRDQLITKINVNCNICSWPGIMLPEEEDDEWDTVYSVEVIDTSSLRDDLDLFIELAQKR